MNKGFLVIALAIVVLSSGCANNSSPEKVLRSFLDKIEEKKFGEAAKLATQNSQSTIKEMEAESAARKDAQIPEESIYDAEKYKVVTEIGTARVTGDLATVIVTYKGGYKTDPKGDPMEYSIKWALEKEDGKWKVMLVPAPKIHAR